MNAINVAVVDDEEFFYTSIKLKLKKHANVKVSLFKSPHAFSINLQNDNNNEFDLVIIDRFFPGIDVIQDNIISKIKKIGFKGKIILSSNAISLRESFDYPGCDYSFPKETTIRRLANIISEMNDQKAHL